MAVFMSNSSRFQLLLQEMLDLYEKINATTAQYKDKNDEEKTISWDEACLKIPTPNGPRCTERSILEIYKYDRAIIEKLKDEDIFQTVNSTFTSPIYGSNFDYLTTLGKPVKNDQDSQIGAEALRMRWMIQIDVGQLTGDEKTERVDKATLAWESAFVDTVDAFTKESEKESEVFQNAARSFMDATADAILGDLQLLFGGYVLVFIYVILVLGRRNLVEIRLTPLTGENPMGQKSLHRDNCHKDKVHLL
ncbi:unnamed protein product [Notodromas monacha]|uniref:Uncharacterized protein n=1 Tax=Notodromas monacha TaxID=399045 RepID=A0A7R9GEB9_9CRUS|nr:unnamed protein product [Notodromas monacha]CAG0919584.1 unnamed protein product [Notodromas monacha]